MLFKDEEQKKSETQHTKKDASGEAIVIQRIILGNHKKFLYIFGILTSLFHLWVNSIGIMPEIQRNAVHFGLILFMGFLIYPVNQKLASKTFWLDYFLAILSLIIGFYLVFFEDALHARNEVPLIMDLVAASIAIILMLEITRRTSGLLIPVLAITFISYSLFLGKMIPGLWNFPGITVERLLYRMYFAPDGLFGTIATISSTFVFLFVLFAAFLLKSGAGEFIINLAVSLMGHTIGGPAKMAVFASGLMGSVSGSAVANTVGTGSITIPMMKKIGFAPKFAAAVEASASTGGQLMPPIMGAGAFIMAQWTQISYLKIVAVSFIPAIMYFLSVAFFIHLRAQKRGFKPIPKDELPRFMEVLKEGWNFFIPIAVLMGLLIKGYTPTFSASLGILSIIIASWLNKKTRMGVKFSMMISSIAGGSIFLTVVLIALASLVLGMGLPVTASYIVLAVLAAPSLVGLFMKDYLIANFGLTAEMAMDPSIVNQMVSLIPPYVSVGALLASHLLIFWYSQDANVTPPVCLAAYSAAGIAGSKPLETGLESWKLAKGLYIIPLMFIYDPAILFQGPVIDTVENVITGTIGLLVFAAFFEGFFVRPMNWFERITFAVLAFLFFWPETISNIIGLLGFAVVWFYLRKTKKKHQNLQS